jgi:hypothetical protein
MGHGANLAHLLQHEMNIYVVTLSPSDSRIPNVVGITEDLMKPVCLCRP